MCILFAIIKTGKERYIRRIDLNSNMAEDIKNEFFEQYVQFMQIDGCNKDIKFFENSWLQANEDELLCIDNFSDTLGFGNAMKEPASIVQFNPAHEMQNLLGIFTSLRIKNNHTGAFLNDAIAKDLNGSFLFQLIDFRHILKSKDWWMITEPGNKNVFVKKSFDGLQLDNKLTAVYRNGKLLFMNFNLANRLLDLGVYKREVSDNTALDFCRHPSIHEPQDSTSFVTKLSITHKKLMLQALECGFLNKLSVSQIVDRARQTKSRVDILLSEDNRIIIPKDKQERGKLLLFLANVLVASYLDNDNDYEAQSTRRYVLS